MNHYIMSGQPYKYASDPEKYRAAFLQSLRQQEEVNDYNLQANKTYKETGQLPPVSQMKDTRTTAEILADKEKLKVSLIEDMKGLGTPNFVMGLIQGIEKSPLNSDGALFTFFVQRAPEIATILKKQYKYGIKGDKNDIEKFIIFVEDMYSKTKSLASTVSQFFTRSGVEHKINADSEAFKALHSMFKKVAVHLGLVAGRSPKSRLHKLLYDVGLNFYHLDQLLSVEDDARAMEQFLTSNYGTKYLTGETNLFLDTYKMYIDLLRDLPKPATIEALLTQLDVSRENKNKELSYEIATKLKELFPPAETLKTIYLVMNKDIEEFFKMREFEKRHKESKETSIIDITDITEEDPETQEDGPRIVRTEEPEEKEEQIIEPIKQPLGDDMVELEKKLSNLTELLKQAKRNEDKEEMMKLIEEIKITKDKMKEMKGKGIGRGRPKGRAKGSGVAKPYAQVVKEKADYEQGIQESPRFVKFGRYLVNQKMLGDGIFSVKSSGGYRVPDLPSTRLSKPLQGIISKMIKGGSLTYDELSTLTEPEKVFLHKVSKKSNIIDKFSIPTPSMDRKDKDIHEFEVMKGEILAGNDNKELIKKFKTHILRLSREGILPKKEVSEIMEILLELGH